MILEYLSITELPLLNDLEVTTGDEGIIILYSYNVPGQWPKVQHIEWSKNGQVLVTNTSKYSGGSIYDRSLTIKLPTEEDKGQYSCKITNAVGCASKDVMLGDVYVPYIHVLCIQYLPFYIVNLKQLMFTFARKTKQLGGLNGNSKTTLISLRKSVLYKNI